MNTTSAGPFDVIGISVRTTNENNQAAVDIPKLWEKFMSEHFLEKIPAKISGDLYCVYTDYEGDYTKPYTTILGCKVSSLDSIPAGLTGTSIAGGSYVTFTAKGNIADGIVVKEWTKIWNTDLPRAYAADFEIYDEKAQNPEDAEVTIYVGVK